jgi:indoleamine 2,3-dioxygenase
MVHGVLCSFAPVEDSTSNIYVPKLISVLLVEVSQLRGIAPVLTFLDTILSNWELIDTLTLASAGNNTYSQLFTGTDDKENFSLASAKVELAGGFDTDRRQI